MRRLFLTLPGLGGPRAPAPPPPPAAPPAPPTQVDARRAMRRRDGAGAPSSGGRTTAENIRNEGGGRGLNVMETTNRALKRLTGQ